MRTLKMSYPLGFLRISARKYNEEFLGGSIYMNPLHTFQKWEDPTSELRGDKLEGVLMHAQPSPETTLTIEVPRTGEKWVFDGTAMAAPLTVSSGEGNAFCLIQLCERNTKVLGDLEALLFQQHPDVVEGEFRKVEYTLQYAVDPRMKGFGDSCVMISDPEEFANRLRLACERDLDKGLLETYGFRPVSYFDPATFDGNGLRHGFWKRKDFEHQYEWRLMAYPREPGPYRLEIGSIADIARFIPTEDLFDPLT